MKYDAACVAVVVWM